MKADGFYVKNLHHIHAEVEDGVTRDSTQPLTIRHNETEFSGFSGQGYVPALAEQVQYLYCFGYIFFQKSTKGTRGVYRI